VVHGNARVEPNALRFALCAARRPPAISLDRHTQSGTCAINTYVRVTASKNFFNSNGACVLPKFLDVFDHLIDFLLPKIGFRDNSPGGPTMRRLAL
jgi:hypothetical protein